MNHQTKLVRCERWSTGERTIPNSPNTEEKDPQIGRDGTEAVRRSVWVCSSRPRHTLRHFALLAYVPAWRHRRNDRSPRKRHVAQWRTRAEHPAEPSRALAPTAGISLDETATDLEPHALAQRRPLRGIAVDVGVLRHGHDAHRHNRERRSRHEQWRRRRPSSSGLLLRREWRLYTRPSFRRGSA